MKFRAICIVAAVAVTGCGGDKGPYKMGVAEARSKLLAAKFEKGILPGFSSHNVSAHLTNGGNGAIEWLVISGGGNGMYCPIAITPVGDSGKLSQVVNDCRDGLLGRMTAPHLDELVDATLTGRPPEFAGNDSSQAQPRETSSPSSNEPAEPAEETDDSQSTEIDDQSASE